MKQALPLILAGLCTMFPAKALPGDTGPGRGIYSEAQANEGARVYTIRCAMCHGRELAGTLEIPGLTGKFMASWAGRPVGDLSDYIAKAMPQQAPGTLSPEDSARLVAFILQANGAPAGVAPLPSGGRASRKIILRAAQAR